MDAYTGIRSMLRASGAKLAVTTRDGRGRVRMSRPTATTWTATGSTSPAVRTGNPVNHLVCLGEGELRTAWSSTLYADAKGDITTSQTLFGLDERGRGIRLQRHNTPRTEKRTQETMSSSRRTAST